MARTGLHSGASGTARTRLHANRGVRVEELRAELDPVSTTEEVEDVKEKVGERIDITEKELEAHVAGLHGRFDPLPTKDDLDDRLDPLPTKEDLDTHVAGLHGRFDPLPTKAELGPYLERFPTKEELGTHVTGLHGHIDQLPTKAELDTHVTGLHGHIDQLPTKAELIPYLERFPTKQDLDTHVADLHKRFDQLPTKDDFKKVAQIIDVIHFILKKWFGIELGELTPEQREKLTHSLRALNRVEALVLDTNLNLEQGNEILNQLSQDTEMQNLLLLLDGIEDIGHPTLAGSFRAMLNARLTSGDIEERTAWLERIQDLRGAIIQHVAGAAGNPPPAASA